MASFIGSPPINLIPGRIQDSRMVAGELEFEVSGAPGPCEVHMGLRPELLTANEKGIPATVETVEPMGREILYSTRTKLGFMRFLEAAAVPRFGVGQEIKLFAKPEDAMFFACADGKRIQEISLREFI